MPSDQDDVLYHYERKSGTTTEKQSACIELNYTTTRENRELRRFQNVGITGLDYTTTRENRELRLTLTYDDDHVHYTTTRENRELRPFPAEGS